MFFNRILPLLRNHSTQATGVIDTSILNASVIFRSSAGLRAITNTSISGSVVFYGDTGGVAQTLSPVTAAISLFLGAGTFTPIDNDIPLTTWGSTPGTTGLREFVPLFLFGTEEEGDVSNSITLYTYCGLGTHNGNIPLYTAGDNYYANTSIPLYLSNSGLSQSIPLYVKGFGFSDNPYYPSDGYFPFSGGITLYLERNTSQALPLFLMNSLESGVVTLYTFGAYTANSGIPLYSAGGIGSERRNIPLYSHGF